MLAAMALADRSVAIAAEGLEQVRAAVGDVVLVSGGGYDEQAYRPTSITAVNEATGSASTYALADFTTAQAAAVVDGKAIFAGGLATPGIYENYQPTDAVEVYDLATGQWSTARLSAPRANLVGVTVGDLALFADGNGSVSAGGWGGQSNVVDVYDGRTGAWSTTTTPTYSGNLVAAAAGDAAVFGPGAYFVGTDGVDAQVYDTATGQWSKHALSVPRYDVRAVTAGGRFALLGGGLAHSTEPKFSLRPTDAVDAYDDVTGVWSPARLSQARESMAAVAVGDDALFAGGTYVSRHGRGYASDVVDVFHGATATWSTTRLPIPLADPVATASGHEAFVVGRVPVGRAAVQPDDLPRDSAIETFADSPVLREAGAAVVEIYDADTGAWAVVALAAPPNLPITSVATTADGTVVVGTRDNAAGAAGQVELLNVAGVATAASPASPADGTHLSAAPPHLAWTAGPGASGYDVYLDGVRLASGVARTQYRPPNPILPGSHVWSVAAHVPGVGGVVLGGAGRFDVAAPRVGVVRTALNVPRHVTAATRGATATVTVRNAGDAPLPAGYTVGVYGSYNGLLGGVGDGDALGAVVADAALAAGARRTFAVPLSFAAYGDLGPGQSRTVDPIAAVEVPHGTRHGRVVRRRRVIAYWDELPGVVVAGV